MRRFITVWSLCCAILFAWSISGQAAIIFDNSSRGDAQINREAENSPIAAITVSAPTSIGQIGAMLDPSGNGNLRYVIFNLGTSALLFQTGPQAFVDTGLGFYLSAPFAGFTLVPGITYGIGAIADVAGLWEINNSSSGNPFTQNNITASDDLKGNVSNFAAPTLEPPGTAMIIVELGSAAAAVPEPARLAVLGGGLIALVLVAVRRRKLFV